MIRKERDQQEHPSRDKFAEAGAKAEEQMAFYLRRAFADAEDVLVLNDLRFEVEDQVACDAVQIDHLVIHRRGMVIVESKSVVSEIGVNTHGEWVRIWNGRRQGMPSPILQARRQADYLRKILSAYADDLRGKMLGVVQKRFGACPFDVIVAVSDRGTISREVDLPEVCKADQVTDKIKEIIRKHKIGSVVGLNLVSDVGVESFDGDEMTRICRFLLEHHYPLRKAPPPSAEPPPVPQAAPEVLTPPAPRGDTALDRCAACGSQCTILWGRYGYYWKCGTCSANRPIKEYCPTCKQKMKLHKDKSRFFLRCDPCQTEAPYHAL
jgi:hypothetical protein